MLRALLYAALVGRAVGWTSISQSTYGASVENIIAQQQATGPNVGVENSNGQLQDLNTQQRLGYLWTFPEDAMDQSGLGGGIAWAWDPKTCDSLLSLFKESLFFIELVNCEKLQAAMHRAFATWSANHQYINFVDVTSECAKLHGGVYENCSLIELWVTARDDSAGVVSLEAASAESIPRVAGQAGVPNFRFTSGVTTTYTMIETYRARIKFGTGNCWYLDSTFCSYFHAMKAYQDPETVHLAGQLTCLMLAGISGLFLTLQITYVVAVAGGNSCRERCKNALQEISKWSSCLTAIKLVLFVTPLLFYFFIFLPCWDCFDFEAAAVHEVGHVLGLGHPDLASQELHSACDPSCGGQPICTCGLPGKNVYNADLWEGKRMGLTAADLTAVGDTDDDDSDNVGIGYTYEALGPFVRDSSCKVSFESVLEGIPPDYAGTLVSEVRESIMISFTQHNPGVCLSEDDLEGLFTLYPDCTHSIGEPVCFKIEHYLGWIRLGIFVLLPAIIALLITILLSSVTQRHQVKRLASAKNLLRHKSRAVAYERERAEHNLRKAREMQSEVMQMQSELDLQKATEESRIEAEARKMSEAMYSSATSQSHSVPKLGKAESGGSTNWRWITALRGAMHSPRRGSATPRSPGGGPAVSMPSSPPRSASDYNDEASGVGAPGVFANLSSSDSGGAQVHDVGDGTPSPSHYAHPRAQRPSSSGFI